jgi:hypothetical protein
VPAAPDLREQLKKLAAQPMSMTPTEFARFEALLASQH